MGIERMSVDEPIDIVIDNNRSALTKSESSKNKSRKSVESRQSVGSRQSADFVKLNGDAPSHLENTGTFRSINRNSEGSIPRVSEKSEHSMKERGAMNFIKRHKDYNQRRERYRLSRMQEK